MSFLTGGGAQAAQAPILTGISIQTSVSGKAVPLVYGATRIAGNLIGYGDFASSGGGQQSGKGGGGGGGKAGGKGGGQTTYSASVMIALCEGPISGYGVLFNNKSYSEVSGTFAEFLGSYSQAPWSHLPSGVPAELSYPGLAYVAAQNLQLGSSAQLSNFNFEVKGLLFGTSPSTYGGNADVVGPALAVSDAAGGDADPSLVAIDLLTNAFYGAGFPASRVGTLSTVLGEAHTVPGSGPFTVTVANAANFNANLDVTLGGTPLQCVAGAPGPNQYSFAAGTYTFNAAQAGAAVAISYASLASSLTQYQAYTLASGLWISPAYTDQTETRSMLDDLAKYTNSEWVWSAGVLTLMPRSAVAITANGHSFTPPAAPLFNLTDDDFLPNTNASGASAAMSDDPVLLTRKRASDQTNDIKIECLDRANLYNTTIVEAYDQGLIDRFGRRTSGSQSAHFFCDVNAANLSAQLLLQREYIRNTYQFTLDQRYCVLDPMDIVTLQDAELFGDQPGNRVTVRILDITENDDGTLSISAEEYPANLGTPPTYAFQTNAGYLTDYNASPGNVNAPVIFEPTYQLGRGEVVWLIVSGGSLFGGCDVYLSSDGESYALIGTIDGQGRVGSLSAPLQAVTASASGLTIDQTSTLAVDISESSGAQLLSGSQADALAGNTLTYVDGEIIAYETASLASAGRYNLTFLNRGLYGSAIAAHAAGSAFARIPSDPFAIPFTTDRVGQTLFLKLVPFNLFGGGKPTLDSVSPYSYVIKGTALSSAISAVTNLTSVYIGNQTSLSWDEVEDFRTLQYEIRVGTAAQGAQVLGRVAHPHFVVPGDGTYWVAAVATPLPGLTVYSPFASITVSGSVIITNDIATFDEGATGWSGTVAGGADVVAGTVQLVFSNILTDADWLNTADILHYGTVEPSGTYTVPAGHVVNAGRVAPCTVSVAFTAIGQVPGANILTIGDFLGDSDILGNSASANIDVVPYIATAPASGTFGAFQKFVPGIYNAQFFKIQVLLESFDPQTQAILDSLVWSVSIPDRVDDYVGISLAAGGTTLVYAATGPGGTATPFNSGPQGQALPQVQVQITNEAAGDQIVLSGASLSQITIQVKNGGVGVARTANVLAKGY